MRAISDALNLSAETLLAQAGLIDAMAGAKATEQAEGADQAAVPATEQAISADKRQAPDAPNLGWSCIARRP